MQKYGILKRLWVAAFAGKLLICGDVSIQSEVSTRVQSEGFSETVPMLLWEGGRSGVRSLVSATLVRPGVWPSAETQLRTFVSSALPSRYSRLQFLIFMLVLDGERCTLAATVSQSLFLSQLHNPYCRWSTYEWSEWMTEITVSVFHSDVLKSQIYTGSSPIME